MYNWHRETIAETFQKILEETHPWVPIGDFLDDWRASDKKDRYELAAEPIGSTPTPESHKWAVFCAAMVEHLCQEDALPIPQWVTNGKYELAVPWYLYPGMQREWREWQETTSPLAFKRRNIFGGDRLLSRA